MNFASDYVLTKKVSSKPGSSLLDEIEPDTNVISTRFDHLVNCSNAYAGDPYKCSNCEALISNISKVTDSHSIDKKKSWKCEFCNFENRIMIENDEIPKNEEVTYILETPSEKIDNMEDSSVDNKYLIYCIDISGSMSVTTEVSGNLVLPTDQARRESLMNATGERVPYNRVKHISRLEALQVAIEDNLKNLEKHNPEKRVGLIAFNQHVSIIGDGQMNVTKLDDSCIDDKEEIKKVAERTPSFQTILKNKNNLSRKLINLEEGGATALGPALYLSILIASRKKGSQVILCTDGLANRGIGSLENKTEIETRDFYDEIVNFCLIKGISVSIITLEGTNCKLGILGEIANKTGGVVNIVNPAKLKEQFSSLLEEKIIATNVVATLILPKALYIRDHENLMNKESVITKEIGNVTKDTEITFEFGLREDAELPPTTTELPFQLKITYNALDGKFLRVITKSKKITTDRKTAEDHSDRTILASHVAQNQVFLAKKNKNSNLFGKFSNYISRINPVKEDHFSHNAYNRIQNNIAHIQHQVLPSAPPGPIIPQAYSASTANAFADLSDSDALEAYKISKISSKDLKK